MPYQTKRKGFYIYILVAIKYSKHNSLGLFLLESVHCTTTVVHVLCTVHAVQVLINIFWTGFVGK